MWHIRAPYSEHRRDFDDSINPYGDKMSKTRGHWGWREPVKQPLSVAHALCVDDGGGD